MNRGATAAIAGIAFSGASFWALRLFSTLHWRVVFAGEFVSCARGVALAFGVLAVSEGRPRWLVWLSFPVTLASAASVFFIQ